MLNDKNTSLPYSKFQDDFDYSEDSFRIEDSLSTEEKHGEDIFHAVSARNYDKERRARESHYSYTSVSTRANPIIRPSAKKKLGNFQGDSR